MAIGNWSIQTYLHVYLCTENQQNAQFFYINVLI